MKKLDFKKSSAIIGGGCSGLWRRMEGQYAKGHYRRYLRMSIRYDRKCLQ